MSDLRQPGTSDEEGVVSYGLVGLMLARLLWAVAWQLELLAWRLSGEAPADWAPGYTIRNKVSNLLARDCAKYTGEAPCYPKSLSTQSLPPSWSDPYCSR